DGRHVISRIRMRRGFFCATDRWPGTAGVLPVFPLRQPHSGGEGSPRLRDRALPACGAPPNGLIQPAGLGALVTTTSEPIFNIPGIVLAIIAVCALVLAGETYLLTDDRANNAFLYCFGFVPARYDGASLPAGMCPLGTGAELWTFVTYAFIHGDTTHLA